VKDSKHSGIFSLRKGSRQEQGSLALPPFPRKTIFFNRILNLSLPHLTKALLPYSDKDLVIPSTRKETMRKKLASLLLSLTALTGCGGNLPTGSAALKATAKYDADWTVFVYMAADNNLSSAAAVDVNEMEAGLSSDRVRFVVLLDQASKGDSRILEIKNDPNGLNKDIISPVVDDKGAVIGADHEVDTGASKTLENFLNWGTKSTPPATPCW
jgi:hypothetical protein